LEVYINIAARCGLIEKAKTLVTSLLEKTDKKKNKLRLLRMMFSIELYIAPDSDKILDICLRYGEICDQNDEVEEGVYLLYFLAATLDPNKRVEEQYIKEFQERLLVYRVKFPESRILRSFANGEGAPETILDQIAKITGLTEEKKKWYEHNENILKFSRYPVPFIVRPSLLINVTNFLHLWELSKIAGLDYPQYLLTICIGEYKYKKLQDIRERIPLLDETALIVLFELGLLEFIFNVFHNIAIAKETIINFMNVAQYFGIMTFQAKAKEIISILSRHISKIYQPSSKKLMDEDNIFKGLDHHKSVYDRSTQIFFSDDVILRIYICGDDQFNDSMSSIDTIEILREKGILSHKTAAEKYAKLCSFNVVGVPISFKDILIILEDDLPGGETIENILTMLGNHKNFKSIINGTWGYKGNYQKQLKDIGQFVAYMISQTDGISVEPNIIAAIWYYWFQKVQFNIAAEKTKIHFFARSFLSVSIELMKRLGQDCTNITYWQNGWSIYNTLIEFSYGDNMSQAIEKQSKILLAQMVSDVESGSKTKIFKNIASGLASDTADSDLFEDAYIKRNVESSKGKAPN